jgi:hypothetical protein
MWYNQKFLTFCKLLNLQLNLITRIAFVYENIIDV